MAHIWCWIQTQRQTNISQRIITNKRNKRSSSKLLIVWWRMNNEQKQNNNANNDIHMNILQNITDQNLCFFKHTTRFLKWCAKCIPQSRHREQVFFVQQRRAIHSYLYHIHSSSGFIVHWVLCDERRVGRRIYMQMKE